MFETSSRSDGNNLRLRWEQLQAASDSDLVLQLKSGNDDAFAVILDRYQRLVLSVALRIVKDESEAEEVVQTVFLKVLEDIAKFNPERGSLKIWLLQYAYSRSISRRRYLEHRQFYSRKNVDDIDPIELATSYRNGEQLSSEETARLIRQALGSLSTKQQTAIELVYFEGLTLDEAAERMQDTLPAVRHHYYRGLMKLREIVRSPRSSQAQEGLQDEGLQMEVRDLRPRTI